jgi:uncharacterized membrane protein SpoIIM required for sporulation
MLEMLINPKKAERRPWEMFFIGAFYASLSILLVNWIFSQDAVLSKYSGILVVTFTVMFSIPFVYYTIRLEEKKTTSGIGTLSLLKEHEKALLAFLWLFVGFVVAYSFWYVVLASPQNFKAQIETYCMINRPSSFDDCVTQYGLHGAVISSMAPATKERFLMIFSNNIYVLIFTLLFSLVFGAGVIFVLAWNASVIAAAVGIFAGQNLSALPMGFLKYVLHGAPEIASYFVVALAGGLVSVSMIRHEFGTEKFWEVLQDSLNLILIAVGVLFIAALLEVFVTPLLF